MKARLLKKVRKRVKLFKRNKGYFVEQEIGFNICRFSFSEKEEAFGWYRIQITEEARKIFGNRQKQRIR